MTSHTRSYSDVPGLAGLYARTVKATLLGKGEADADAGLRLELPRLAADPRQLASYCEVTGFAKGSPYLPVTYPHILAFPLHLDLMSDPSFPFRPMGIVHLTNTITQHRPVPADATLAIEVRASELRPHTKGTVFDLLSDVLVNGEPVWSDVTTLLSRGRAAEDAPGSELLPDPGVDVTARWELESNLGRRYAGVSGDRNPIHLYKLTAQAFGFPRQIAHGMWAKAAALAEIDAELPDAFSVRVDFRKPLLLPAKADFGYRTGGDGVTDLAIYNPDNGEPHLIGKVTPAQ
ncbi:MAG TPA: MaoC/PaaZ C-terminal domain-containing protein [Kribbellaceae bacterium]